jgi:microcin C transport system permease protein
MAKATTIQVSTSLMVKRWRKFKSMKRGYWSLIIFVSTYLLSFLLPLVVGNEALVVRHEGQYHFPLFKDYIAAEELGQKRIGDPNYRELKQQYQEEGAGDFVVMPWYPFGPKESLLDLEGTPPHRPSAQHWLGTDDRARDVMSRLLYGYRVSISFALIVTFFAYLIGVTVGGLLGYYGGTFDILVQRLVELWGAVPFLFMIMIIVSLPGMKASFGLLVFLMVLWGWMGLTRYVRGEFYREKTRDYVQAAISMGASDRRIIFKHILPNSLTPIISFAPFAVVGNIGALVGLDFLGFGLPPEEPSWGNMVKVGMANITDWWLVLAPEAAFFLTLLMVVFIGEGVREAFDPKVYSRLR